MNHVYQGFRLSAEPLVPNRVVAVVVVCDYMWIGKKM